MTENSNGKILIVDDDAGNRKTLSLVLANRGYSVETAATGKDAMKKISQASYDASLPSTQARCRSHGLWSWPTMLLTTWMRQRSTS